MISQFTTDVRYVLGSQSEAGDTLSRLEVSALDIENSSPVVDFQALALAQMKDPDLSQLCTDSSLRLEIIPLALFDGATIICDVSMPSLRLYVPASFWRAMFDSLHGMSHPGPSNSAPGDELCGQESTQTCRDGLRHAQSVNGLRYIIIPSLH